MRAITVCVNYADLLSITLPYNFHHFEEVWVVTAPADEATQKLCSELQRCNVLVHTVVTDLFYQRGAEFNKWAALEHGLDVMGRHGVLCIMDADILWPKRITWNGEGKVGYLYTPLRYMHTDLSKPVPREEDWPKLPLHPQQVEWAGYTQIFNADDSALGRPPWHETNWKHAGGADSFFQRKWPQDRKLRPSFRVVHLGPSGVNWCGRVTPYLDGTVPAEAHQRQGQLHEMISQRRRGRLWGDAYQHEKLG